MNWIVAALLVIAVVGCSDSTGPEPRVFFGSSASATAGEFGIRCDVDLTISSTGGDALFQSGSWSQGSGTSNNGPLTVEWFVDVFGSNSVPSGGSLSGGFYTTKVFASQPFDFDLIFRFQVADGSLRSYPVSVLCEP